MLLALRHCHHVGLVHNDVKPDNVLEGSDGRLKLGDFGVSYFAQLPSDYPQNGDPQYMPLEAMTGTVSGAAADVFCLGLSVVEMATGKNLPSYFEDIAGWHALVYLIFIFPRLNRYLFLNIFYKFHTKILGKIKFLKYFDRKLINSINKFNFILFLNYFI
jgi:serine/threonine protein kinase